MTFDELWEELKNESEESRQFFQKAEDDAKRIFEEEERKIHEKRKTR